MGKAFDEDDNKVRTANDNRVKDATNFSRQNN